MKGGSLLMLNEFITGFGMFIGYYVVAVLLLLMIRVFLKPPKEIFRKLLHTACFLSVFVLVYGFNTWYLAMLTAIIFSIALYPLITYIERFSKIMEIFIQRKNGEIKLSLLIAFFMMAVLIGVFWGLMGEQ